MEDEKGLLSALDEAGRQKDKSGKLQGTKTTVYSRAHLPLNYYLDTLIRLINPHPYEAWKSHTTTPEV